MGKPPVRSAGAAPSPRGNPLGLGKLFPTNTDARTPDLAYLTEDHDLFFLFLSPNTYILLLPAHNSGCFVAHLLVALCIVRGIWDA